MKKNYLFTLAHEKTKLFDCSSDFTIGFGPLFRVGLPHNGIDLGMTGSDLSFPLIKTPFSREIAEQTLPETLLVGSSLTLTNQISPPIFGPLFRLGPPHNGIDLGVTWSDLSFAPKKQHFPCEIVERVSFQCE